MNYYDSSSFIWIGRIISFWGRVHGLALRCGAFAFRIIRAGGVALSAIFHATFMRNVGFISVLNVISVFGVISVFDVILFHVVISSIFIVHAFLVSFQRLHSLLDMEPKLVFVG